MEILAKNEVIFGNWIPITPFLGNSKPITVKCNTCGCVQEYSSAGYVSRAKCKNCGLLEKTEAIRASLLPEYTLLSEYRGTEKPLIVLHNVCGNIRSLTQARGLLQKDRGCPYCTRHRMPEDIKQELVSDIEDTYGFMALDPYTGKRNPIRWQCNKCGSIVTKSPEHIRAKDRGKVRGLHCDCCKSENASTEYQLRKSLIKKLKYKLYIDSQRERMQQEILDLAVEYENRGFEVISIDDDFKGAVLLCKDCGREFHSDKQTMKKGHGCYTCAKCGTSAGVKFIEDKLRDAGIEFLREVKFPTCVKIRKLPFDFGIVSPDGDIIKLIEFNGEQHYRATRMFGGNKKLEAIQQSDSIKRQWAVDNDIELLVIKWSDDIGAVLDEFISRCDYK